MTATCNVSLVDIEAAAAQALKSCGVSETNAGAVAHSIMAAERDGQPTVGLSYLPTYCDHAACGKVDGAALPVLQPISDTCIRVDAKFGFAHPAIALGMPRLSHAAHREGIALLAVGNSYACGSLGYFVEKIADDGLIAIMVANASPSIAAHGAKTPFFGTNPLAFACPRGERQALVIDQSTSVVAKVAIIDAQRRSALLSPGWALDIDGQATLDADAAMSGSLCAIGGYKGVSLALMIDILAAGLTGSNFSNQASSFGDSEGGPPGTGQLIIAINPTRTGGLAFLTRTDAWLKLLEQQPNVRTPGARRLRMRRLHEHGVDVPAGLWDLIRQYGREGSPMRRPRQSETWS